jgi:hypothetical protein
MFTLEEKIFSDESPKCRFELNVEDSKKQEKILENLLEL